MKLIAALLLLASAPAQAAALTVHVGETWLFTIKNGEPAQARKVAPSATVPRGQIKVAVRAMLGTAMTVTNNSPIAYTFRAELVSGGKATVARSCTLPSNARPAFEQWEQKAEAVRISGFRIADADGHC
ncbi:MAG TPA: hypothetical protein VFH89_16045 [Sphingomicrobium sp.]|nr:hypothetical protein [Sphingomicrobium sp.]